MTCATSLFLITFFQCYFTYRYSYIKHWIKNKIKKRVRFSFVTLRLLKQELWSELAAVSRSGKNCGGEGALTTFPKNCCKLFTFFEIFFKFCKLSSENISEDSTNRSQAYLPPRCSGHSCELYKKHRKARLLWKERTDEKIDNFLSCFRILDGPPPAPNPSCPPCAFPTKPTKHLN
jgi:hypothetical protein